MLVMSCSKVRARTERSSVVPVHVDIRVHPSERQRVAEALGRRKVFRFVHGVLPTKSTRKFSHHALVGDMLVPLTSCIKLHLSASGRSRKELSLTPVL